MKKTFLTLLLSCLVLGLVGCGNGVKNEKLNNQEVMSEEQYLVKMYEAKNTPYGKYPELIEYTLAKMTGSNNSNMPEGDTYENNAYTRYLKEYLNIQNRNLIEEEDDQYFLEVDMSISGDKMPDIMIVSDTDTVVDLAERGLIEDLTESYEKCTSDVIKDIYASYGNYGKSIFENITVDGKLMAIPETNISEGPNLIWLRKDWLDDLGLEEPKTVEDLRKILAAFVEENPGKTSQGDTVGLIFDTSLCGETGYSSQYQLDAIFACFDAYPKQWIYGKDGQVVYGSVQPEVKEALEYINEWYEEGVLDRDFLFRTPENLIDLIVSGRCGAFFSPWWAPNNPLMEAVAHDEDANWQPYLLETHEGGITKYHGQNSSYKYVVVRKGFEYPEIVCKMISLIFDYSRYEDVDNEEMSAYFRLNVDPTARPIAINVDYSYALSKCYETVTQALAGKVKMEDMPLLERSYYVACKSYIEKQENATLDEWAAYQSRITACSLLNSDKIQVVESLFFGETSTMRNQWWKLKELESQTYLKIICGEEDSSYFDTFVQQWHTAGGAQITNEVRSKLAQ